jgi:hypothetical protein
MILRGTMRRAYEVVSLEDEEKGACYIPEQLIVHPNERELGELAYAHQSPSLIVSPSLSKEERGRLRSVLLWLDENLPEEPIEREGFRIVPFHDPIDIAIAPHPNDQERLQRGQRKRITELPEWEIFFPATKDAE